MNRPITILIVDDHVLIRDTLKDRLDREEDLSVVAVAGDADEGVSQALKYKPDLVLMDIEMPGLLCFDAARTIRSLCPDTRIIFLSAFFHHWYIDQALSVEASGYLTKDEAPESVIKAVRTVASAGIYFSPEIQDQIVVDADGPHLVQRETTRTDLLTPREIEVLRYIASGLSKKDIAKLMRISVKTVDRHAAALMAKLGIHDRVGLARFVIREGLAQA